MLVNEKEIESQILYFIKKHNLKFTDLFEREEDLKNLVKFICKEKEEELNLKLELFVTTASIFKAHADKSKKSILN